MKRRILVLTMIVLALLLTASGSVAQEKVGPGFTYQGLLKDGGNPANGTYDFEFWLYDAASGGILVGGPETMNDITVTDGLFTVLLDFGTETFAGNARWLEIGVRPGASTGAYTTLTPRQALTPVPYAAYAERAPLAERVTAPAGHILTTLDGDTDNVGPHTSVTIGADGLALISYYDGTNGDLKVAHCNDAACSSATTTPLDSTDDVGYFTSITIGTDGLGLISYYDWTNANLKVAHCNDIACSSAALTTLDSIGNVGWNTSVAIGGDGLGLISYCDVSSLALKVAHCNDTACSGATLAIMDDTVIGSVGYDSSVTIGADGLGLISYYDAGNGDLKIAHCNNTSCSNAALATLDSTLNVGQFTSITTGPDGLGLVSYYDSTNGDLKVAHCNDATCSGAALTTLDSAGDVGQYTSVTIGADGLPLISYYDDTNDDLKVAHCNDITCSGAILTTLDSTGDAEEHTSVTIGADGLPLISYFDPGSYDLKTAHCSNVFCTPYFRRR